MSALPILFAGQPCFGSDATVSLVSTTPPVIEVSGTLAASTSADVSAQIQALQSLEGIESFFVLSPGTTFPNGSNGAPSAHLDSTTVGNITGGGPFQATFSVTIQAKALGNVPYPPQSGAAGTIPGQTVLANPSDSFGFPVPVGLDASLIFTDDGLLAVADGGEGGGSVTLTGAVTGTEADGVIETTIPFVNPPTTGPSRFLSGPFLNITGPGNAVANTTVATSIFTGATFRNNQSLTIPADVIQAGQAIRLWLSGVQSVSSTTTTFLWTLLLGGVVIAKSFATTLGVTTSSEAWNVHGGPITIYFPTVGSGGSVIAGGIFNFQNSAASGLNQVIANSGAGTAQPVAINTTGTLALDLQVQWNTASAGNSFQLTSGYAELVG
jgi:hypothetical protein